MKKQPDESLIKERFEFWWALFAPMMPWKTREQAYEDFKVNYLKGWNGETV